MQFCQHVNPSFLTLSMGLLKCLPFLHAFHPLKPLNEFYPIDRPQYTGPHGHERSDTKNSAIIYVTTTSIDYTWSKYAVKCCPYFSAVCCWRPVSLLAHSSSVSGDNPYKLPTCESELADWNGHIRHRGLI